MSDSSAAPSIRKLAIRGTIWTVASYGISNVLRFGSNLILTYLLAPRLFGLMALVNTFVIGLHLFSDIGIGPSIIQSRRGDDPKFLNTAWTLQVIRGFQIWIVCLVLALPAAHFYNEPTLVWLFPIVGLTTVINGFGSTALFTLNRHLSVRQLSVYELGGQVVGIVVMVTWAWFDRSIWALVMGGLVSSLIQLIWSHRIVAGVRNHFCWEKDSVHEIITFGKWIFVSTALTFLATQSDRMVLGKLFTLDLLGVYGIAFSLADIPKQVVMAVSGKVIFPAFAKFAELPRLEFRQKIHRNRRLMLLATAIGLAGMVSFGDLIVQIYRDEYAAAAWMLPILAVGVWPAILNATLGPSLLAIGNPRYSTYASFWGAVFLIGGVLLGFRLAGPVGAVFAVSFSNLPSYLATTYGLWREKLSCIRQDVKATLLFLGLTILLISGRTLAGFPLPIPGSS
jgi:O-antigen/teichoic acid export membrane protein